MRHISIISLTILLSLIYACTIPDPNINNQGQDELKSLEITTTIDKSEMKYQDIIYVPIYSDIYVDEVNQSTLISATLSIRNTSFSDSLFISNISYYNTEGELVRNYIDNSIILPPMATVNYVIEREDDTGGPGANFIVSLSAKKSNVKPLIQAIMIGKTGNKAFAFDTDGYSVL